MKDNSDIPFWGKQKPLKKYFKNGVINFSVKKGELYSTIKFIDKTGNYELYRSKVENKEALNILLGIKKGKFESRNQVN